MWACEKCGTEVIKPYEIYEVQGMMLCVDCSQLSENELEDADQSNDDKWLETKMPR